MGRKHRKRTVHMKLTSLCLSICAVALVIVIGAFAARFVEKKLSVKVENAGEQITAHSDDENTAQVYVDDCWYRKKDVDTLLVIGIDDYGAAADSNSYNNSNQADFLVLFITDNETGESTALHINRDTMADITMLGVTGEDVGTQHAQLALAFNYGRGLGDSSRNTADAVKHLLYGTEIDRYITVTMDAVEIMNDWAGGVTLEVLDDMTSVDSAFVKGSQVTLTGDQALAYVRTRKGLDDSTNINRMKRQRQYASAWAKTAQEKLTDSEAVAQLVVQMSDYYHSDCTAEELAVFADRLGSQPSVEIYELPGEARRGAEYMEFYADDAGIIRLVLDLFYVPAGT